MKSLLRQVAFFFLFVTISFCQITQYPTGVHQHDGFFLRFVPGTGYSQLTESLPDNMMPTQYRGKDFMTFSGGFTFANNIQIGGSLSDNLILFADFGGVNCLDPSVKVFDEEVKDAGDIRYILGGFGPGVSYYFMPDNIYISISILAHFATVYMDGRTQADTKTGFGFNLLTGKEWWAGEQWGLGVSVYFKYGTQKDKNTDDLKLTGYSFGVLFSATYN